MKHYLLKALIPCIFTIINLGSILIARANGGDTSIVNMSRGDTLLRSADKYHFSPTISWGDEFNYSGSPDRTKWGFDIGNGYTGWGNNEQQYYRAENAVVTGSTLKIIAKSESFSGYSYTSAKLNTVNSKMFRYGRFEIRAKLPVTGGMWPAAFMFGQNHRWYDYTQWPECGEIDVFELSSNNNRQIHQSIHNAFYNYAKSNPKFQKTSIANPDRFNNYRIDWTPDYIRWFINGVQSYEFLNDGGNHSHWPFDDQFSLILSLSVGGNFTGKPDVSALPQYYEVDYVRHYELLGNYPTPPVIDKPAAPTLNTTGGTKHASDYFPFSVVTKPVDSTIRWYFAGALQYQGDVLRIPPEAPLGTYVGAAVAVVDGVESEPVVITVNVVPDP